MGGDPPGASPIEVPDPGLVDEVGRSHEMLANIAT
jgi:hypothetical protein